MISKEPFLISAENLNRYLNLTPDQFNKVAEINNYFLELQKKNLNLSPDLLKKQMMQTVYDNVQSMKDVLTSKQYLKYLSLLNVINKNRLTKPQNNNININFTNNTMQIS